MMQVYGFNTKQAIGEVLNLDSEGNIVGPITVRHGTSAEIDALELFDGEFAVVTDADTHPLRLGDGSTLGGNAEVLLPANLKTRSVSFALLSGQNNIIAGSHANDFIANNSVIVGENVYSGTYNNAIVFSHELGIQHRSQVYFDRYLSQTTPIDGFEFGTNLQDAEKIEIVLPDNANEEAFQLHFLKLYIGVLKPPTTVKISKIELVFTALSSYVVHLETSKNPVNDNPVSSVTLSLSHITANRYYLNLDLDLDDTYNYIKVVAKLEECRGL